MSSLRCLKTIDVTTLHILLPGDTTDTGSLQHSPLASARLRLWPAAKAALGLGYSVTVGEQSPQEPGVLLVGKIGGNAIESRAPRWLTQIEAFRRSGSRVLLDYTDHHLASDSVMRPFYEAACQTADVICVPTHDLKAVLETRRDISGAVSVVADPLEHKMVRPKAGLAHEKARLLWFGHPSNALFLAQFIQNHLDSIAGQTLHIVSTSQTIDILKSFKFSNPPQLALLFNHWSTQAVSDGARQADYCVIPSDLQSHKRFASNNRLITALNLGLPTIATALPSYSQFGTYFSEIGTESALKTMANPLAFGNQVRAFQDNESHRFSMASVESSWKAMLSTH